MMILIVYKKAIDLLSFSQYYLMRLARLMQKYELKVTYNRRDQQLYRLETTRQLSKKELDEILELKHYNEDIKDVSVQYKTSNKPFHTAEYV